MLGINLQPISIKKAGNNFIVPDLFNATQINFSNDQDLANANKSAFSLSLCVSVKPCGAPG